MKSLKLEICLGTGCCLMGAQDLMDVVTALPEEKKQYIELNNPSCLKGCRKGPSIRVDGVVFSEMTPDKLIDIVEEKLT